MRAQSEHGVGLVLAAGGNPPLCLGANVIVPLGQHIAPEGAEELVDVDSLARVFEQHRARALGGMVIELAKSSPHTATLYVPGNKPYAVMGANAILIFERLVEAVRKGSPAVPTKHLLDGLSYTSPRQAFRDWEDIIDVYVAKVGKRGGWRLLT